MKYNEIVNYDGGSVLAVWVPTLAVAYTAIGTKGVSDAASTLFDFVDKGAFTANPITSNVGSTPPVDTGSLGKLLAIVIGVSVGKVDDSIIETYSHLLANGSAPNSYLLNGAKPATSAAKKAKKAKIPTPSKPAAGPDFSDDGGDGAGVVFGVLLLAGAVYLARKKGKARQ